MKVWNITKEVYAENIKNLKPSGVKLYNMIKFVEASKRGGKFYNQPIALGYEFGFSYGGTSGAVITLDSPVSAAHENTQVKGSSLTLSSYLSMDAASRSMNSKAAFVQETKYIVENMFESFMVRLEAICMYGGSGIGEVESVTGNVIKIEDHEWAAGLWAGCENMPIEIRSSAGVKRGETSVLKVDMQAKTVEVDGLPAGVVGTDVIFHKGAYDKEAVGLHKIASNTTDTLFGVDASQYSLFQGNIVDVGASVGSPAVLSFAKIEEAVARMMEKGLSEEEITVLCNPLSWKNLLTDLAAKRSFDQSYSQAKLDQGAKEIVFHGPNGMIKIVSSIFCKEGYSYIICPKEFLRIGSTEVTFNAPGLGDKMVKLLERATGYEFRAYADEALFTAKPGKTAFLRYITSDAA